MRRLARIRKIRNDQIIGLCKSGLPRAEVAKILNTTKANISLICIKAGVKPIKPDYGGMRRCPKCKRILDKTNFYRGQHWCKECDNKRHADYMARNPQKSYEYYKKSTKRYPEKYQAHVIANKCYPIRQQCEHGECTSLGERHHQNYNNPQEIIWLCRKHHAELHRLIKFSMQTF